MKKGEIYKTKLSGSLVRVCEIENREAKMQCVSFEGSLNVSGYTTYNRRSKGETLLDPCYAEKYDKIKSVVQTAIDAIQKLIEELKQCDTEYRNLQEGDIVITYGSFIERVTGYVYDSVSNKQKKYDVIHSFGNMVSKHNNAVEGWYGKGTYPSGEVFTDREKANLIFDKIAKIYDNAKNVAGVIMGK